MHTNQVILPRFGMVQRTNNMREKWERSRRELLSLLGTGGLALALFVMVLTALSLGLVVRSLRRRGLNVQTTGL